MQKLAIIAAAITVVAAADAGTVPDEKAFENYVGFSQDGFILAYAERVPTGLRLRWLSSTTNTVEKTSSLDTPEQRAEATTDLAEDGFPMPGAVVKLPPHVTAELRKGRVVVLFGNMPASRPFRPFLDRISVTPESAAVVAVSPDGKLVAVRVTGKVGQAGTVLPEYRVVTLFE